MGERVRTTISLDADVLKTFEQMAEAAGMSVSRCMGDWLADTQEGAQFVLQKMVEARRAPVTVMREMQAAAAGLHEAVGNTLDQIRAKSRDAAPVSRSGTASRGGIAPSSNTGLKVPRRGGGRQ